MYQVLVTGVRPMFPKRISNSDGTGSTNSSSRITRYTAESHVQALRTILPKVAPAKIASSYELHCLDQLLKQVMENKISLRDSIADMKGILKNFDLHSPEVADQINKKVQHRLGKYGAETVASLAVDLASHIESDAGSESLFVLFDAAASKLLPETCKSGLKSSFASALLKFGMDGAKQSELDQKRKSFNDSVDYSILQMRQTLLSDKRGAESAMKLFIEKYIPGILSEALAASAINPPERRTKSLQKFSASQKAAEINTFIPQRKRREKDNSNLIEKVVPEARKLIGDKPKSSSETEEAHIANAMKMLVALRDTFQDGYGCTTPEAKTDTSALIAKYASENQSKKESILISGNVSAWLDEVQALANEAKDTIVKLESISSDFLIGQSKVSMLDNVHAILPPSPDNSVTSKGTIEFPMSAAAEPKKIFAIAEKEAEDAQLIVLTYRFIESKDRKYAATRALVDAKIINDETAIEDASLDLEKIDSRIEFYLEEMKRNGASKDRMNDLAKRERGRLTDRSADIEVKITGKKREIENLKDRKTILAEQERIEFEIVGLKRESVEIGEKISRLNKFLMPIEQGGQYQANEFVKYFR